jgi:hypothetical protein
MYLNWIYAQNAQPRHASRRTRVDVPSWIGRIGGAKGTRHQRFIGGTFLGSVLCGGARCRSPWWLAG